jgi:hypothetical protein
MTLSTKLQLFNSPLETGVRSVVLLHAATPRAYDLTHLTWLDHLVVHTGDVAGPPSLHPDIPQRAGELVVRRQIVEEGLRLMSRLHMVEFRYTERGILYATREDASLFVQLILFDNADPPANASSLAHIVTFTNDRSQGRQGLFKIS